MIIQNGEIWATHVKIHHKVETDTNCEQNQQSEKDHQNPLLKINI